jgi:lactate dehydrogenase-like 2-hydroxyacid dehydrogenase
MKCALIKALSIKKIKYAATDVVRNEQNLTKKNNKLIEYSKKNNNLLDNTAHSWT